MSNPIPEAAQTSMNKLSKKMGAAGVFLAWLFYQCTAPDKERVIVGSIVTILFVAVTIWRDYIQAKYNPSILSMQKSFMGRMSAALAMTSGFLTGLLTSNISMEYKMWGGFSVVVVFMVAQGLYDTMKARLVIPTHTTQAAARGNPPTRPPL